MHKYKITLEYDGTDYVGWQRQENGNSIQAAIEKAIEKLTLDKVIVFAAGRTDAGVHARNQVATFDTESDVEIAQMARGINYYLPEDIVVKKVVRVDEKFDPRREAKSRIYKYSIFNSNFHSPLNRLYTHRVSGRLDREMMKEGAKLFLGTHDFSKFAGKVEKNKSTVRTIFRSTWDCENEALVYEVEGNAASQAQFYVTDSINHFLTGAIYFRATPNFDSIYPAAAYLKNDIKQLMETVEWQD